MGTSLPLLNPGPRGGWRLIEEVVHTLEKCIDKIDSLRRRIEFAPKWKRAQLHRLHRELEELRTLVVEARRKIGTMHSLKHIRQG